ncbi:MAG: selenium-dependent molybdenum cofactor biosynthesis protein YqeB [Proteocatella sp.]
MLKRDFKVLIKGSGDLATGVACRLFESGFSIIMTEIPNPTAIRRTVAFSEAVYNGRASVEGIEAVLCNNLSECKTVLSTNKIAVVIDETASIKDQWEPDIIVDAILAKVNLGMRIDDAPITIGVGPGFTAQKDCHCVVESQRGHYLGKCIYEGSAAPNTGIPGNIGGYAIERVIKSPAEGIFKEVNHVGDYVKKDDVIAYVNEVPVLATIDGILRGQLKSGLNVHLGMKIGDIDPRAEQKHCFSVSDKARSIGGGVLEAIMKLGKDLV